MRRIGVLTSGGDAPGMNASTRAVVRTAIARGLSVCAIRDGYRGLIKGRFEELSARSVSNTLQTGGTILGTSRCPDFLRPEMRARAADNLRQAGIEGLVVLGGDGSFHGAVALHREHGVPIVGIPATIDNDIPGTDHSLGFDTAVNTALQAIDRIRDTADALGRIFFVEVMGRGTGFLALEVGLAGGADEVVIPEERTDPEEMCARLRRGIAAGKRSSLVIVAEGEEVGGTLALAQRVRDATGAETRVAILGHIQRGGVPTAQDRVLGAILGAAAVEALLDGYTCHMVGRVKNKTRVTPLEEVLQERRQFPVELLRLLRQIA